VDALPLRKIRSDYKACLNTRVIWLDIGGKARITPGSANNLRGQPSAQSKKLASIPGGAAIMILDGPVCDAKGTAYWKVRYKNLEGWTAQGDSNENWIVASYN
jgi:hypothetical protein